MFILYNQLYTYGFSEVNLLGSSPDTALHLQCKVLGMSPVKYKSQSVKLNWHSCFSKMFTFFFVFSHMLLLTHRFRVGFGVGGTHFFKCDRELTF